MTVGRCQDRRPAPSEKCPRLAPVSRCVRFSASSSPARPELATAGVVLLGTVFDVESMTSPRFSTGSARRTPGVSSLAGLYEFLQCAVLTGIILPMTSWTRCLQPVNDQVTKRYEDR